MLIPDVDIASGTNHEWQSPVLPYFQNGFSYCTVFARQWTFWGSVWKRDCIGATSLTIRLYHIPCESKGDSLFDYDYCRRTLESMEEDNRGYHISLNSGGQLGQNRNLGYTGYRVTTDCERTVSELKAVPVECEHLMVFEFFMARAPEASHSVMEAQKHFADQLIESVNYTHSEEIGSARERIERQYAERVGGEYDEEMGCTIITLDCDDTL